MFVCSTTTRLTRNNAETLEKLSFPLIVAKLVQVKEELGQKLKLEEDIEPKEEIDFVSVVVSTSPRSQNTQQGTEKRYSRAKDTPKVLWHM